MANNPFLVSHVSNAGLTRATAAVLAIMTWTSLAWTFYDYSWGLTNLLNGVVSTSLYYSHFANLFIAVYFTGVALGKADWASPRHYGHVLIIIGILCAHYWLFRGSNGFWTSPMRSQFLHGALGPMLLAYYLFVLPKGEMEWKNAATWTVFPLIYTFYGMIRGMITDVFPYAISDVNRHGYPLVFGLIAATTLIAWMSGMSLVAFDKALAKGSLQLGFQQAERSGAS